MVNRVSMVARGRQAVLSLIRAERLTAGDRLPSVAELATHGRVSVAAMREALQGLQANGLVEIRQGIGVFVRRDVRQLILPNVPDTDLDATVILDLLETRLLLEPRLSALAASRASDEQIRELEAIIDRSLQDGLAFSAVCRETTDFHRALARASGHTVLTQVVESLLEIYANEHRIIALLEGHRERDHSDHVRVLEAVRTREPDDAFAAMSDHLRGVTRVLRRKIPGMPEGGLTGGGQDEGDRPRAG